MVTVILEREPYKHNLKWRDKGEARAFERLAALCDLHGCTYTRLGDVVLIHASETYKGATR